MDFIRSHSASRNVIRASTSLRSVNLSCYTVRYCCLSMKNWVPWEQNNRHLLEISFPFILVFYCIVVYGLNNLFIYHTNSFTIWWQFTLVKQYNSPSFVNICKKLANDKNFSLSPHIASSGSECYGVMVWQLVYWCSVCSFRNINYAILPH